MIHKKRKNQESIIQESIIDEVRRVRENLSKEYHGNHAKLSRDAQKIAKEYGMKYAKLRPVARSLQELTEKKKKNPAA